MNTPFESPRQAGRLAVTLLALAGCGRAPVVTDPIPLPSEWDAIIADARNPEPSEVVHDLIAILEADPRLRWTTMDGSPRVRMVTVVSDSFRYAGAPGRRIETGQRNIWVTAVPELQDACRAAGLEGEALRRRVRQLLGLTPGHPAQAAVELWVRPADLFRPTPDPEITDSTAGLSMPDDVPPWYRAWFNGLRATQYFESRDPLNRAYPWTQLGYTYDWGAAERPHRGLSEFVVRDSAVVVTVGIAPVERYCAQAPGQ